ncbi:MAG: hypothetical protein F4Y95_07865 [Chloroflexi bacterium]|nr:hypothetical protein [Chloroflexota bacterium]
MEYRVALSDDARAEMARLSPNTKRDVNEVIERLRLGADRHLDLPLQGVDLYRALAARRWRVIFEVLPGRQIMVRRIRRRGEACQGIEHPDQRDLREPEVPYEAEEICSPVLP